MARYNEILVGRFNRFLQKLTQIKGGPPTPQLAGDIVPSIPLFNGRENRYLDSTEFFMGVAVPAVVAAQTNAFQLRNPAGSNVVAVVESCKINVLNLIAISLNWSNTNTTDLATASTIHSMDSRGRLVSTLIGSTAAGSPAAFPVTLQTWSFNPATAGQQMVTDYETIVFEDQEWVIPPGVTLQLLGLTVNVAWHANVTFRERFLEESERA